MPRYVPLSERKLASLQFLFQAHKAVETLVWSVTKGKFSSFSNTKTQSRCWLSLTLSMCGCAGSERRAHRDAGGRRRDLLAHALSARKLLLLWIMACVSTIGLDAEKSVFLFCNTLFFSTTRVALLGPGSQIQIRESGLCASPTACGAQVATTTLAPCARTSSTPSSCSSGTSARRIFAAFFFTKPIDLPRLVLALHARTRARGTTRTQRGGGERRDARTGPRSASGSTTDGTSSEALFFMLPFLEKAQYGSWRVVHDFRRPQRS